jgi:probable rRNA maturation factor
MHGDISIDVRLRNPAYNGVFSKSHLESMRDKILGKGYELSLVIAGVKLMRSLNMKHCKIDKPTDVLSFPLNKSLGEVFICPEIAERKAPNFGMSAKKYLIYLVIHAMLHLKGFEHGSKMEATEQRFLKVFSKF